MINWIINCYYYNVAIKRKKENNDFHSIYKSDYIKLQSDKQSKHLLITSW